MTVWRGRFSKQYEMFTEHVNGVCHLGHLVEDIIAKVDILMKDIIKSWTGWNNYKILNAKKTVLG